MRSLYGSGATIFSTISPLPGDAECVVGEVEDPDKAKDAAERALRERRLQFYLRAGYRETGLRSVVFGADYRILEVPTAKTHTTDELREVYTALCRSVLPPAFFRTQFHMQ